MPNGKPAYTRCIQLSTTGECLLFGRAERPAVCSSLAPSVEMCGITNQEAHANLVRLEELTKPSIA